MRGPAAVPSPGWRRTSHAAHAQGEGPQGRTCTSLGTLGTLGTTSRPPGSSPSRPSSSSSSRPTHLPRLRSTAPQCAPRSLSHALNPPAGLLRCAPHAMHCTCPRPRDACSRRERCLPGCSGAGCARGYSVVLSSQRGGAEHTGVGGRSCGLCRLLAMLHRAPCRASRWSAHHPAPPCCWVPGWGVLAMVRA